MTDHEGKDWGQVAPQVTALELPKDPFATWTAIVGEPKLGGVIVAYSLDGFSMTDRVLVG